MANPKASGLGPGYNINAGAACGAPDRLRPRERYRGGNPRWEFWREAYQAWRSGGAGSGRWGRLLPSWVSLRTCL